MTRPLLIRNAHLLDGTGSPQRRADIRVVNASLEAVESPGMLPKADCEVLDAHGLTLAPGFIDVHSHADNAPFLDEDDTSKVMQGVTTEIVGNCGFSLGPRSTETAAVLETYSRRLFPPLPWTWHTFADLMAATDARGYVTNYAPLLGHHAVRIAVLGMSDAAPDTEQVRRMQALVDEAMEAGAFGFSSGLIYPPGLFAATDELVQLATHLSPQRPYVTHMRGEGSQLLTSIAEAATIGERADRRVQVSHLKSAGRQHWGRMATVLDTLDRARDRGIDLRHDVYPYTAGSTMLTAALPPWFQEGGDIAVLDRLADRAHLERLRDELAGDDSAWENHVHSAGWSGMVVASSASHTDDGRSIAEIAQNRGTDPFDAFVEVLRRERLQVSMIVHLTHEDDLTLAMAHPATMVGSDGLPPGVGGKPHPRMYGTFPRVLARYVRDLGILALPEAVRRMTSLPAEAFGLADRGVIAPGKAADLVALNPATVRDRADYSDPLQPPEGIAWVMINGRVVVHDSQYLGPRAGRRLIPAH